MRYLQLLLFILSLCAITDSFAQAIFLDEEFSDWGGVNLISDVGDSNSLDLESLAVTNDDQFIYFKIELDREVNLQTDNNLTLDIETPEFRLEYRFGDKEGRLIRSGIVTTVNQFNLKLISSPTVSSTEFEIRFGRQWNHNGNSFTLTSPLQVAFRNGTGDRIPDTGNFTYELDQDNTIQLAPFMPERASDTDFRLCSYNVLRDQLFESDARGAYTRLLDHINADIYCFQEIYDHDSEQTLSRLFNVFGVLEGNEWYHSKRGSDIIIISKYPIEYARSIAGNGVFVLDMDGQPVMIINLHLPCCDNDSQRENEIDIILKFIREAKLGNENYDLQPGTPIIITGDTNFVGNSDQVSALKSGDIFNNSISGPDFQIDWDTDGLKDLKPLTANTNTSYTWLSDWEGFSPGRLDYVFYSDSHLIQKNSFVIDTRELTSSQLDQNNLEFLDTNRASDHLPVIADFSLQVSITEDFSELIAVPYPNPAQDWITIDEIGLKQLIGLDGKVILQTYGNSLLLSGVKAGLYLIRITDEKGQSKVHKVLVAD